MALSLSDRRSAALRPLEAMLEATRLRSPRESNFEEYLSRTPLSVRASAPMLSSVMFMEEPPLPSSSVETEIAQLTSLSVGWSSFVSASSTSAAGLRFPPLATHFAALQANMAK